MPIVPDDLLEAARKLGNDKKPLHSPEACARTIVNRAYYAAYLATREAIRSAYGNPRFDVGHTALAKAFSKDSDTDVAKIGQRLDTLRILRSTADYHPDRTVDINTARLRVRDAQFILTALPSVASRIPKKIPDKHRR